jgi:hypothetical protein
MTLDIVVVAGGRPRYAPAVRPVGRHGLEEGIGVSFIKKAQEAAAQAAESARGLAQDAAGAAGRTAADPATQDRIGKGLTGAGAGAREAIGMAKRGMTTVIEKIDPGTLAELVIKATALQEMTNKALRQKGSPYRISEISISASIPPSVSFAIQRLDDEPEELGASVVASSDLVEQIVESGDLVLALDGTTVDAIEPAAADVSPGALPPSSISSD